MQLRPWTTDDIDAMAAISGDHDVMRYFPSVQDKQHVTGFVKRQIQQFDEKAYCYFATELRETRHLIGFIGISYQEYEAKFTPCIDIGWRLGRSHWGKGYATEGAKACLDYAFRTLNIKEIVSVAACINTPSIHVMKKLGMQHQYDFEHTLLTDYPHISKCSLYTISNPHKT